MIGDRTPLSTGFLYGLTAALFGGSLWALLVFGMSDESSGAPRWIVLVGGILSWFLVGFLIGAFNAPRAVDETGKARPSLVHRILSAVGWFFYRLVVGYFVGGLTTFVLGLVCWTPWFVGIYLLLDSGKEDLFDRPVGEVLLSSMAASLYCGFSGGIFGALMTTRRYASHRPPVGSRAARSCFLSFVFGIPFGASLGWLTRPAGERLFVLVHLAASVPVGVLAGILGGLWADVRDIRADRNC